eukprot:GEZU01013142.1.p1 GENE.GEZU01013142.1~~GEZU01013142.1.p1  ORF type:complete len:105 (+),score=35.36 GEZU01013142.1:42-356(+)
MDKFKRLPETKFYTNPEVEKWTFYRENIHKEFRWTPRTVFRFGIWGVLVPYLAFIILQSEFNSSTYYEQTFGRPNKFIGDGQDIFSLKRYADLNNPDVLPSKKQ